MTSCESKLAVLRAGVGCTTDCATKIAQQQAKCNTEEAEKRAKCLDRYTFMRVRVMICNQLAWPVLFWFLEHP